MSNPLVVFSSCEGPHQTGDWPSGRYNGGVKLQNLWVKLLRQHGVEACIMTLDGKHQSWLIEHQPHVSYETARGWRAVGEDVRLVTTWMAADMAMDLAERPYFFDAEIGHSSCGQHFNNLKRRIGALRVGTHSRTQQAWYMATFGITPAFIREWSDPAYWRPKPMVRERGLIGYMHEGPHTDSVIMTVQAAVYAAGLTAQFIQVQGDEADVIAQMQCCDLFLGVNAGKHDLWGEGCPRAAQEAMHCGAVVVAFDVHGNHEYLIDGYSGYLVPRGDAAAMAERVVSLLHDDDERETVRETGLNYAQRVMSPAQRWPQVKAFLEL